MTKVGRLFEDEKRAAVEKVIREKEKEEIIKGKEKEKEDIIHKLIVKGMDLKEIMEITGCTKAQIEELKSK